jgi:hypothetical protein
MKLHPLIQKTLSYILRLIALAAIFIGGVIAVFLAALGTGIMNLGFYGGNNDVLGYAMMIIIPSLAVIFLSWIFYRRDIKRTLIFWGITAIIGTVIAIPFAFDSLFGHKIEIHNERQNAQQSDYIFEYPNGTEDRIGIENATRYVNLKEMKIYWETPKSFGYSELLPARADTPEEYFAEMTEVWYVSYTWDGNGKIKGVYAISHISTPDTFDDILIQTADGRLFYAGYGGHYL